MEFPSSYDIEVTSVIHSNGKNMVISEVLQPDLWEIVYLVTVGSLYFSNGLINIVFSPAPDLVGFGGIELFSGIASELPTA